MAEKGDAQGAPVLVTSFADFTRKYGGYLSEFTHGENRYLAGAVEQFFANGGSRCFIARVIPEDAKKAEASAGCVNIQAVNEGAWGNRITLSVKVMNKKKMQLTEKAKAFLGMKDEGAGKRTGIQAFLENKVVSIMAVPGITDPNVVVALVEHCENTKSRFAVLDMPRDMTGTDELREYRGMIDSTYAAMYHPWVQCFDRASKKSEYFPPSGAVTGVYARTDNTRGVHKAPANETVACTGLNIKFTKGEQERLNPEGVNLIRAIPGQGIRIWGARTASSNAGFRYVNVRRLFIYVEESIKANTNWVVFEPNDEALWGRVSTSISSFLETLWRNGMFAGASAAESFFVDIGMSTMTQDDIRNGRLICNVGIAPSRPAEFVIFRVTQKTAEAGA